MNMQGEVAGAASRVLSLVGPMGMHSVTSLVGKTHRTLWAIDHSGCGCRTLNPAAS